MFKFCFTYIEKYRNYFAGYFMLILLTGLLNLVMPMFMGKIIDLIDAAQFSRLLTFVFYFAILQIFLILLNFIKNRTYIKLQTNTAFDIMFKLINHIQKLSMKIVEIYDTGYLNQRINNDSNSITIFVIGVIGELTINVLTFIFSIFILLNMNLYLGLIMIAIGILYIVLYLIFKKLIYKVSYTLKEEQASFFSAMLMQLNNTKFIKIHSLIKDFQKKFYNAYTQYYKEVIRSQNYFFIYSSLDSIISLIANIFVFIIGGRLVMESKLSIGQFTIIISYFNYIIQSFKYFSVLGKEYQDNKVSYNRIKELYMMKEEIVGTIEIEEIKNIECQNLGFKRNENSIFSNIDLSFESGNIYCICGPNGKGKSTLIDTIIGLHPSEYTGKVLYNGLDIETINMEVLRYNNISFMEQQTTLMEGEIEENILLSENYYLEHILTNLKKEGKDLKPFLSSLQKINGDRGGVSGGEGRRIGLYRLFAKEADVYILDEPTASLDKKNIKIFMEDILYIKSNKIIIIVSHDAEVIDMCDYIIKL